MDRHGKTRIALGVVLATFSAFAALSLVSWTVSYWRISSLSIEGGTVTDSNMPNWCGAAGTWFSSHITEVLGAPAAFFALGLAIFWTYLLLAGREKPVDAALKVVGSAALVVSVSALTALAGGGSYFVSTAGTVISRDDGRVVRKGGVVPAAAGGGGA